LKAAAREITVLPCVGDLTTGRTGAAIKEVVGELKSAVVLLEDSASRLCIVTLHSDSEWDEMRAEIELVAAETLGLKPDEIINISSHNHCSPLMVENGRNAWNQLPEVKACGKLTSYGLAFIQKLRQALEGLRERLVPVTVEWGIANEERVTYNRRGYRQDGKAYLIREEDRLLLGEGYIGTIDPEATVVVLRGTNGNPVAGLVHFTGHPVSAYHPEHMIAFGEWPQVACEILSKNLDGVPVAFLQGCAGDINSKYMLSGTVAKSRELGEFLGETLVRAASSLRQSQRGGLGRKMAEVNIPLAPIPNEASLSRDLTEIDDFIRRADAGDENTLYCVGMNFPRALSPQYRARLVEMVRPWYKNAIEVIQSGGMDQVPKVLSVEIAVARIGDVGIVGMPFETYVRTGLKIKREAPLPCMLPCGYSLRENGYIPDAYACADREYMSGFFRYSPNRPPFAPPGGDAMAEVAIRVLREL
jgi:hypothetical protein